MYIKAIHSVSLTGLVQYIYSKTTSVEVTHAALNRDYLYSLCFKHHKQANQSIL